MPIIKISDLLDRRHVIPGLPAADKAQLLDELAQRAGIALKLDPAPVAAALLAREQLGSTGVGQGIAIPHARIAGLPQPFGLFARLERAIDFTAVDGVAVDLVFLLLSPIAATTSHLPALAAISRRLRETGVAAALRNAPTARDVYDLLTG